MIHLFFIRLAEEVERRKVEVTLYYIIVHLKYNRTSSHQKKGPLELAIAARMSVPSSSVATSPLLSSSNDIKLEPSLPTTSSKPDVVVESVQSSSNTTTVPKQQATKSDDSKRPAKKNKVEKYYLEVKWYEYDIDNNKDIHHSLFVDDIPKGTKFSNSQAFLKKYEGENHEYHLTFCLVDSKSEHRNTLVEIGSYYWNLPINLMHFHILSQDLANFCRKLWVAAGKNEDVYCDMSIEFGESKYSKVEIKKLIGTATGIKRKSDILYVKDVKLHPNSTVQDAKMLIEMIFKKCTSASFIVYEVDLKKLGINEMYATIGLQKMKNFDCYIGPTCKF